MPRLNERMHRLLCRAGFVILCALPTCLMFIWIVVAKLPAQRTAWEIAFADQLDANVAIGAVTYPQPGVTRLEGICVTPAHSQSPLAKIERLELRYHKGTWFAAARELTLRAEGHGLGPLLKRCVPTRQGRSAAGIELLVERVLLEGQPQNALLRQLVMQRSGGPSPQCVMSLLAGDDASAPLRLDIHPQGDGTMQIQFDTGSSELPAQVAAWVMPQAARLGNQAGFQGTFKGAFSEAGLSGKLTGRLDRIDLKSLTSGVLPPELAMTGQACLTLADVQLYEGRIVQANGSLRSSVGTVGQHWIESMAYHLKLEGRRPTGSDLNSPDAYAELSFDFALNPRQFQVTGRCTGLPAGAMLTSRQDSAILLNTSAAEPQLPSSLARVFSPITRDWIPATPQAQWLLQHLPATEHRTANRSQEPRR